MSDLRRAFVRVMVVLGISAAFLAGGLPLLPAQQYDPALYSGLRWRMIGPFRGGPRQRRHGACPGSRTTSTSARSGGGVWKSTNAGRTWAPVFDSQPIASIGAIGVAPSNPDVVYVGTGEARHAVADLLSATACTSRPTPARPGHTSASTTHARSDASSSIRRTRTSCSSPRSGTSTARTPIAASSGRATAARRGRRCCSRTTTSAPSTRRSTRPIRGRLRGALEHAPSALEHLPAVDTGPAAACSSRPTAAPHGSRSTGGPPDRGPRPHRPRRRAHQRQARLRHRRRERRRALSVGRRRRDLEQGISGDNRALGTRLVLLQDHRRSEERRHRLRENTAIYRSTDAGKTWTADQGRARRRRLPSALDRSRPIPARMIVASDQGAVVSVDGAETWSSWYNQPIAAALPRGAGLPVPLLGDRRAAGQRRRAVRSRSLFADISTRDWARLCAGGEAGYTAPDPLHPEILFGGTVTRCNVVTGETTNVSPERDMTEPARHTWTLPLVFSKADPARPLLQQPVPVQDNERRRELDADQPGPHARGSRRPAEPRRGDRRRRARRQSAAASSTRSRPRRCAWPRSGSAPTTA